MTFQITPVSRYRSPGPLTLLCHNAHREHEATMQSGLQNWTKAVNLGLELVFPESLLIEHPGSHLPLAQGCPICQTNHWVIKLCSFSPKLSWAAHSHWPPLFSFLSSPSSFLPLLTQGRACRSRDLILHVQVHGSVQHDPVCRCPAALLGMTGDPSSWLVITESRGCVLPTCRASSGRVHVGSLEDQWPLKLPLWWNWIRNRQMHTEEVDDVHSLTLWWRHFVCSGSWPSSGHSTFLQLLPPAWARSPSSQFQCVSTWAYHSVERLFWDWGAGECFRAALPGWASPGYSCLPISVV